MCGIAGYVGTDHRAIELIPATLRSLAHRGPDDSGVWHSARRADGGHPIVTLGARRLSIHDLTEAGHQPMASPDERITLVFNGEIYNHGPLRRDLQSVGYHFQSTSDTEVFLAAWVHWGVASLDRVRGMFAVAVHDRVAKNVVLARDCFGIKPLYYATCDGGTAFASETAPLLDFPGVGRHVDPQRLHTFLIRRSSDYGDGSLLTDVHQVPPAHYLVIHEETGKPGPAVRFWGLDPSTRTNISYDDASARVRELFVDSVRQHLSSDVPIGFALSGGVDSSAVVSVARQLLGPDMPIHVFTYVSDHPQIGEGRQSAAVADELGCIQHPFRLEPEDLVRDFDALIARQGEPFHDPVVFAQYRLCVEARNAGVKVLLNGEGGDELLAGYNRFAPAYLGSLLATGRWWQGARLLRHASVVGSTPAGLLRRGLKQILPAALATTGAHPPWLREDWFVDRGVSAKGREYSRQSGLKDTLVHFVEHAPLPGLLRYQDRNAMAWSIENRVPFLSRELAEFVISLPENYLFGTDGIRKKVFRSAMKGIVPQAILQDRRKMGFAAPTPLWLTALESWVKPRLEAVGMLPFMEAEAVQREWSAVRSHQSWGSAKTVWRCLTVAAWAGLHDVDFT